ncbi:MAG: carbohydrate-binding family 9-like protein [Pyrinomonadaceae bacterium]
MPDKLQFNVKHTAADFAITDLDNAAWKSAFRAGLNRYWNGRGARLGRRAKAKLLWSDTALYVLFEANQTEPLVVAEKPDLSKKAMNLWDRDVVEIFVAPDRKEPKKYFEFEAAPTGEWLDVGLDSTSGKRVSDWDYASGMEAAAKIEKDRVVIAMKIPWSALGTKPKAGDVWLGNLLRCVGKDPDRGYLTWSPTMTKNPDFHVPERFGEFHFVK